jgi:hypothetical protein
MYILLLENIKMALQSGCFFFVVVSRDYHQQITECKEKYWNILGLKLDKYSLPTEMVYDVPRKVLNVFSRQRYFMLRNSKIGDCLYKLTPLPVFNKVNPIHKFRNSLPRHYFSY